MCVGAIRVGSYFFVDLYIEVVDLTAVAVKAGYSRMKRIAACPPGVSTRQI